MGQAICLVLSATGMMDEGDGLAQSGGDFVIVTLEVDGVVVADAPGAAQGEVQIEQRGGKCSAFF